MKKISYRTSGVCAAQIDIVLNDDNTVNDIVFYGGCDGNHKGLVALCKGMKREDVIAALKGIRCGFRDTSCPDQLARALETV